MRQKYIWTIGAYQIEKVDGNEWFLIYYNGVLTMVYKSLRGARSYVSRKTKTEYNFLKNNPKVLFIDADKNI